MQLKIVGNANLAPVEAQFMALTRQVDALNAAIAKTSMIPQGGNPQGFAQTARAVRSANAAYANALASTGKFRVEQLKLNDAVDKHTQLMQQQKLNFREVWGGQNRKLMKSVYREQLAMQQMMTKTWTGGVNDGKLRATMAIPTEVHKSWDTLNNKVGFFRHQLASGSQQLVNWGKNTQWAGRQLMTGITLPVAAFGAAAGVMAYQVDKQMTRIQKVYDTTANANSAAVEDQIAVQKELDSVREAGMKTAVEAAHTYGASVTDTLQVQAELAATGQRGMALQKGTAEVMRISTLGEIDHAVSTKALIALQATLGQTTQEAADSFNYMNSIENATSLSMADFAEAIPRALGPMKEMGGGIEELGLLLVALKERGYEAGESANSIKALGQRIFRPSPQIKQEWKDMMGINIEELVAEKNGKIMEILPEIAKAVEGLDRAQRQKALAGLFGTYQVGRMNAMLNGFRDMEAGIGQTTRALEINQQTTEEWAAVALREQKKIQQSASGQFKITLESLKAELALIGDPFLEVATTFLSVIEKGAQLFNSMPKWAKKAAILIAIFAALVGPTIMLVGLFANFAGNIGKFAASSLKLISSFEMINKAQWASRASARLAEAGFASESSQLAILKGQLDAVTYASERTAIAMHQMTGTPLPMNLIPGFVTPGSANAMHGPTGNTSSFLGMPGGRTQAPNAAYARGARASELTQQTENAKAAAAAERERLHNQTLINTQAAAENRIKEKTQRLITAGGVGMGLMAASMGTMMFTSNDIANNIAKWALVGGMVLPMMSGMAGPLSDAGKRIKEIVAAQKASVIAGAAGAANTGKLAGGLRGAGAAAKGLGAGMMALMGPIGWSVTAIAAIGVGLYAWRKHQEAIYQQEVENQRALDSSAQTWADSLGKVAGQYERIAAASVNRKEQDDLQKALEVYQSGDQKDTTKAFNSLSEDEQALRARKMFLDLRVEAKMTRAQATLNMQALFMAIGNSSADAAYKAGQLAEELSDLKNVKWGDELANQADLFNTALEKARGVDTIAKDRAKEFAEIFSQGFSNAAGPKQAKQIFNQTARVARAEWEKAFAAIAQDDKGKEFLRDRGITDAHEYAAWFRKEGAGAFDEFAGTFGTEQAKSLEGTANAANSVEKSIIGAIASYMHLGKEIDTVYELQHAMEISAKMMNYDQAVASATALAATVRGMSTDASMGQNWMGITDETLAAQKDSNIEMARATINQMNLAHGYKEGGTLAEALANLMGRVEKKAKDAADTIPKIKTGLDAIPNNKNINVNVQFSNADYKSILQSGMAGVQDDMANAASAHFDSRMNSALDSAQRGWDARIAGQQAAQERASTALDNRQEAAQNAFENRWDRRKSGVEKYYDARIKGVEKAIKAEEKAEEIRQRIFDAEQKRLERLAESANRTIDFNVALATGNFDEAAKIRNDMTAQAEEWQLADEAERGSGKSANKIDRLNAKSDKLGEKKDKALEALERQEKAERASLERRQKAEKAHLDRLQQMRTDALKQQSEADMAAQKTRWEHDKTTLDSRLELFKSYTGRNQADLERWMKKVGLTYDDFGIGVKRKGENWSKYFENSLTKHVRQASAEIASSNMWEQMGGKTAKKILMGMGFSGMTDFKNFIKTGRLPKSQRKKLTPAQTNGANKQNAVNDAIRHSGGWIGNGGKDSRQGVARTVKGVHPSESMVLARKKEFMVNEKAASKHGALLESINDGSIDSRRNKGYGVGGGSVPAIAGLVGGMAGSGFARGLGEAIQVKGEKAIARARRREARRMANQTFQAGKAGVYSDRAFGLEQLKNAATIASVGSKMGMSKRDIMIGIMTAITESGLINIHGGDRDSQGLFQQRPSMGWGTVAQVTNPKYAAGAFFRPLRAHTERNSESPWLAAQHIQRSAFSDGSNYRQYWDNARAIFERGLTKRSGKAGGGGNDAYYVAGTGGFHKPSVGGKGWSNSHDYRNGIGSPLYAYNTGKVVDSRAITSGGSPGNGLYGGKYRSYGETIAIRGNDGAVVRYAHLNPGQRYVRTGQTVKGGALIGRSGMTGNASGPHTHFDVNGSYMAREWFREHGIGLKTGGFVQTPGMANLHDEELVVDKLRTKMLFDGIENLASGGGSQYNVNVNVLNPGASADEIANKVTVKLKRAEDRKPTRRR